MPAPPDSTAVAQPKPYKRWEIQELWRTLDERWPPLPAEDVARWVRRFSDGRTPYSRVRSHAIHCQLEAIIVLALSAGMRRGEIYASGVDDVHPDNEYILVRRSDGTTREVPHSRMSREALAKWLQVREAVNPSHDRAWLNLWAGDTVTEPMTSHRFEKLLGTYVGEGWTLRRLRNTCAVEWLRAGLSLTSVQTIMGHRSVARLRSSAPGPCSI